MSLTFWVHPCSLLKHILCSCSWSGPRFHSTPYLELPLQHLTQPHTEFSWIVCLLTSLWSDTLLCSQNRKLFLSHAVFLLGSFSASYHCWFPYLSPEKKVKVALLSPTPCDPMDWSLPVSSAHRILHARILEWVVIPFSRSSSRPRDGIQASCFAGRFFIFWAMQHRWAVS